MHSQPCARPRITTHRLLSALALSALACLITPQAAFAGSHTEDAGTLLSILIPATALGASVLAEDGWDGSLQFGEAFVTNTVATEALKRITNKKRPNGGNKSFPSGHTSAAFMGAAFIQKRYGWEWSVPAYVGASYVGYSRVQVKKHYTVDVVAGAALGVLSSYYFTTAYKGLTITPVSDSDTLGVQVQAKW